ncbi:hypothetical protein BH11MYX2_BH11MYX2_14280 [soil metagenome]
MVAAPTAVVTSLVAMEVTTILTNLTTVLTNLTTILTDLVTILAVLAAVVPATVVTVCQRDATREGEAREGHKDDSLHAER